ncbi:hypothetical protein [Desulfotruncus alcoholivorax]|uniref:hypothetical protein n=1 Tax=Desulfotruncus alcoholivorax TaxID=265477 RepID=UPI00041699A6|nr:hypothetical protein [Desulfotruncus alcoholivorax]
MHNTKEHILIILQRIKQALWQMDKEYGIAGDYFSSMQYELDTIVTNVANLTIYCEMHIESLEKLIDLLKNHVEREENEVIREDIKNLINTLEKEIARKIKKLN